MSGVFGLGSDISEMMSGGLDFRSKNITAFIRPYRIFGLLDCSNQVSVE